MNHRLRRAKNQQKPKMYLGKSMRACVQCTPPVSYHRYRFPKKKKKDKCGPVSNTHVITQTKFAIGTSKDAIENAYMMGMTKNNEVQNPVKQINHHLGSTRTAQARDSITQRARASQPAINSQVCLHTETARDTLEEFSGAFCAKKLTTDSRSKLNPQGQRLVRKIEIIGGGGNFYAAVVCNFYPVTTDSCRKKHKKCTGPWPCTLLPGCLGWLGLWLAGSGWLAVSGSGWLWLAGWLVLAGSGWHWLAGSKVNWPFLADSGWLAVRL